MSNLDCQSGRPRTYQTGRGLWLKPLRILVHHRYTDAEVAWVLARLSPAALRALFAAHDPTDEDIEALVSETVYSHWSAMMVKHHRRRKGIASRVPRILPLTRWWAMRAQTHCSNFPRPLTSAEKRGGATYDVPEYEPRVRRMAR